MTLGFLSGSKNFCKLLCLSWEVFVLHRYDCIHWVAKSCTTTTYRWLFRDSQHSLRTFVICCNEITKIFCTKYGSANASSARGPCDFCPLTDISQFRSLEKWEKTLCLPKSTLLVGVGTKDGSWEELACESLRSGTPSSTRFSLNSCSHSGISEQNGSHRSNSWSSFLFGFGFLVGLVNGSLRSFRSTCVLDTGAGWESDHSGLPLL